MEPESGNFVKGLLVGLAAELLFVACWLFVARVAGCASPPSGT